MKNPDFEIEPNLAFDIEEPDVDSHTFDLLTREVDKLPYFGPTPELFRTVLDKVENEKP